jgi:nucleotide-binding universal stress UspA family protein
MYKKILVGTDGSDSARRAVARAVELAERTGAELVVLHVYGHSNIGYTLATEEQPAIDKGNKVLAEAEKAYDDRVEIKKILRGGDASAVILDVAEEEAVDAIVVGNKGMAGTKRFLVGSVPDRVSHHAACDVVIVHTT